MKTAVSPHREVCISLLSKFPNAGNHTLARIAYRQNKSLFATLDAARQHFRTLRGSHGVAQRHKAVPEFVRENVTCDGFGTIPQGKTHWGLEWGAVKLPGPMKALILPDIHIPYHDAGAVSVALNYGKARGADTILLNGDQMDCYAVSRWENDPRQRNFAEEIKTARALLAAIRQGFKGRLVWKDGNHEERYERYLRCKAPELLGIEEFRLYKLINAAEFGIAESDWIGEKRPLQLGRLNDLHGHEYSFPISNPVNPARGLFLRAKTLAICSHFHQTSQHSEKDLEGKVISTWSTGCLCDLHPDYRPLNPWNHGFAFVEVDSTGSFELQNLRIIDGRVF